MGLFGDGARATHPFSPRKRAEMLKKCPILDPSDMEPEGKKPTSSASRTERPAPRRLCQKFPPAARPEARYLRAGRAAPHAPPTHQGLAARGHYACSNRAGEVIAWQK